MQPTPVPAWKAWSLRLGFTALIAWSWLVSHRSEERATPESTGGLAFEEVAKDLGIEFAHVPTRVGDGLAHLQPQVVGTGAAVSVVDVDGDGWMDLYTTTMGDGEPNALFRNRGDGTFEDIAARVGLATLNRRGEGVSHGAVWADVDQDGDPDVYVYKWGRSQLFLQGDDGVFQDVTEGSGLGHWMNCTNAVWFDYDRDGWLDLFLGGYYRETTDLWDPEVTRVLHDDGEFASNGGRNHLFRGLGPGEDGRPRFEDVSDAVGIGGSRWTYGCAAADFNGDGWPDLYLANDFGAEELFLNQEGERFDVAEGLGLDAKSKSGMCVAVGDVSNRGQLAVFVTNISESKWLFQGNNLRVCHLPDDYRLENLCSAGHAAQNCGWAYGADFGDLDNDGDQDLFVVNGFRSADPDNDYWYQMSKLGGATGRIMEDAANWVPFEDASLSGYQRSRVLLSVGRRGKRMVESGLELGVDDTFDGRAVVMADLFNDGTLDVVVANQAGPLLVYRNRLPVDDRWIGYSLRGKDGNPDAIGAQVTARYGDSVQLQVVTAGVGFCSQTDPRIHFGLGDAGAPSSVEIRWPSGRTTVLEGEDLEPGRYHTIQESDA